MRIVNKKRFFISLIILTIVIINLITVVTVRLKKDATVEAASQNIVLSKNKEKKSNMQEKFKVVLDPGHGGVDKGTNVGKIYEKDIVLKIAKYAEAELKANGCEVVLTRNKDKFLYLKEIGTINNDAQPDAFVSIHINSNKDTKYKGVSTYYYDLNGYQKDERLNFAKIMQKQLVKNDNWKDMGTIRQNLSVLRSSNAPAILVECGFLSNTEDKNKLMKEATLKNLGKNIASGILDYLKEQEKNDSNND